jgi:hypothetical protein
MAILTILVTWGLGLLCDPKRQIRFRLARYLEEGQQFVVAVSQSRCNPVPSSLPILQHRNLPRYFDQFLNTLRSDLAVSIRFLEGRGKGWPAYYTTNGPKLVVAMSQRFFNADPVISPRRESGGNVPTSFGRFPVVL